MSMAVERSRVRYPTLDHVRRASRNGKEPITLCFDARPVRCGVRSLRKTSLLDFDLGLGNHDLSIETQEVLWRQYQDYCRAFAFQSRRHPQISKSSIMLYVKSEHAEEWFRKICVVLDDVDSLERIRCDFFRHYVTTRVGAIAARAIVKSEKKIEDGDLLLSVAPAWHQIVQLLQFDPEGIHAIPHRRMEELVAGAYLEAGYARVVLTPRSGDLGRDIIAETGGPSPLRVVVEVKAYKPRLMVTAQQVRSALSNLLDEPATTKVVFSTTSDFAPRLRDDPKIRKRLGGQLHLLNGRKLAEKLIQAGCLGNQVRGF